MFNVDTIFAVLNADGQTGGSVVNGIATFNGTGLYSVNMENSEVVSSGTVHIYDPATSEYVGTAVSGLPARVSAQY